MKNVFIVFKCCILSTSSLLPFERLVEIIFHISELGVDQQQTMNHESKRFVANKTVSDEIPSWKD
jgi:hypothetical protein